MPNHLMGYRRTFFELRFANVSDLLAARRDIMPIAEKNKKNMNAMDTYAEVARYSILLLLQYFRVNTNTTAVPVLALTFLMTNEMMRNDLMPLFLMQAILLWILGNGTCRIMCG
jgi:hypothetical protein